MEKIIQKYTVDNIIERGNNDFLFFWSHHNSSDITKSCLSQWYDRGFAINGVQYKCAEQYMMAQKARIFNDDESYRLIIKSEEPKEMKALGRMVKGYNPELWGQNKFRIVFEGNYAKFTQNADLKDFILSTAGKILVEASPYDNVWGIGMRENSEGANDPKQWKGSNLLGFALTQVRDVLKSNESINL